MKEANTKAEIAKDLEKSKRLYIEKRLNMALREAAKERNVKKLEERKKQYEAEWQILSNQDRAASDQ